MGRLRAHAILFQGVKKGEKGPGRLLFLKRATAEKGGAVLE